MELVDITGGGTKTREVPDGVFFATLRSQRKEGGIGEMIKNSIGMTFVRIPKGTFMMGSPPDEPGRSLGEHQHEVTLSRDFHLGVCAVTQAEYAKVIGVNPSFFLVSPDHPVDNVTHSDAQRFCRMLSRRRDEQSARRRYRLPTEAEWEYACRAGSKTAFSFGDDSSQLGMYAWYDQNSNLTTHAVGCKRPNKFGLYDMHGNVWEWCSDWYSGKYDASSLGTDPQGPESGTVRVLRGGSWDSELAFARCANRLGCDPDDTSDVVGFRVVLE